MRGFKRSPWLFGLGVLLAIPVLVGGQAKADVHTDQGGSLIIFPKVIADGTRDTIIKITNKSNMPTYAHCFYTNALGICSDDADTRCLTDDDCSDEASCRDPRIGFEDRAPCAVVNFDIFLTAQQPTFWRASTGRFADLTTPPCVLNETCSCTVDMDSGSIDCPGFPPGAAGGINSLAVQGVGTDFVGELRCYQTQDDNETPISANSLIGEAVLVTLESGDHSQYNAITVSARQFMAGMPPTGLNTDLDLELDDDEFNSCPESLVFTHYRDGAQELASGATMSTELTLVPCTVLTSVVEIPQPVINIEITDEMESRISVDARAFGCHLNQALSDIDATFGFPATTTFLKTRITADDSLICMTGDNAGDDCVDDDDCEGFVTTDAGASLGCRPSSGVLGVVEQFYSDGLRDVGSAAWSVTNEGQRGAPGDIMSFPAAVPLP